MDSRELCKEFYRLFPTNDVDDNFGFFQTKDNVHYYCTPVGAEFIGWTGVDGIHLCFIPSLDKDMVFVINPMNFGDCVYPIARSFRDFLSLIIFFGSFWAMEQPIAPRAFPVVRSKQEFFELISKDKQEMAKSHKDKIDKLRVTFDLTPKVDAYEYLKKLQSEFDYSSIPFSKEYDDLQ